MVGIGAISDVKMALEEAELLSGGSIVKVPGSEREISRVKVREAGLISVWAVVTFRLLSGDTGFSESDLMSVILVLARVRAATAEVPGTATESVTVSCGDVARF